MTIPVHVHVTLSVARDAALVAERLRTSPSALSAAATADALRAGADLMGAAGFRAGALPTVEARAPADDEIGHLVVRWRGDEDATGWPAMTIWVVALPDGDGTSKLALLSPRHPGYDLSTNRVDKLWRDRLARTAVRSFGVALRHMLEEASGPNGSRELADAEPVLATVGGRPEAQR